MSSSSSAPGRPFRVRLAEGIGEHWACSQLGGAQLVLTGSSLRFVNLDTSERRYSNAQLDDYQGLPRRRFLWSPPLILSVRARFSHRDASICRPQVGAQPNEPLLRAADDVKSPSVPAVESREAGASDGLLGTAGFGFWNDPFWMSGRRAPALPRAIWFFYASPPSNMKLDSVTPGFGWKAATIDAATWSFVALAPTIPITVPLMRVQAAYRRLWPLGQRAIGVSEALVPSTVAMTEWHTYTIEWGTKRARFFVDNAAVLDCDTPPRGPLGLVLWKDNQFLVITPQGRLRQGLLGCAGEQWMEVETLEIARP